MARSEDLTGQKFGKLTVVERVESKRKGIHYLCVCECKAKRIVLGYNLRTGNSKSCGHKKCMVRKTMFGLPMTYSKFKEKKT